MQEADGPQWRVSPGRIHDAVLVAQPGDLCGTRLVHNRRRNLQRRQNRPSFDARPERRGNLLVKKLKERVEVVKSLGVV